MNIQLLDLKQLSYLTTIQTGKQAMVKLFH